MAVIFAKNSERLKNKHNMEVCGETMINRISRILYETKIFDSIILFTKNYSLECNNCNTVCDYTNGILIDSILYCIKTYNKFLAVGGDMPLIDYDIINKLIKSYNGKAIAYRNSNYYEPLFSIYNMSIYNNLKKYRDSGNGSISKFMSMYSINYVEINTLKLKSVNYYNDLLIVRKYLNCI